MNTKFSELVQYFREIACQHIEIGHSCTENHFYRFEIDEVLIGLKTVNYPALILEGYRCNLIDNKSDNSLKDRTGAFILLDHLHDLGDFDTMHAIWDRLEGIADDIVIRIKKDKRNSQSQVIRDFDLSSVEYTLIANEQDKNFGVRCTFKILTPFLGDCDETKWNYDAVLII